MQKHGIKLRLQEQPFQILKILLEHPGRVVSREELRKKLWPADTFVDFDVGLNNAILRLRNTLGDSAEKPQFIETLPRRGYRFLLCVHSDNQAAAQTSVVEDSASVAAAGEARADGQLTSPARRTLSQVWLAVTAFAAVLALLLGLNTRGWRDRLLGKPNPPHIQSLAVMPLENFTGDPAQEYFADGMTDALITDLAQVGALRVISRTSAMQYKGKRPPLHEIVRDLNVDAVVEGSVVRSGNRVRITAQLIEARTDRHLWAKSYEGDLSDIVSLQDNVARGIATEVRAQLTPHDQARLAKTQRVNPAAYEAYLRGRFLLSRWSVEQTNKALQYFQQAISVDANYAQAYSGISDCYRALAFAGGDQEDWQKAKAAANRALELDEALAEAHRSLATVLLYYDWDPSGSEREHQRALQLNPGDAETYRLYGTSLAVTGRSSEASALHKRAQELDPLSPIIASSVALNYYHARQYDQAIEQSQKVIQRDPTFLQAHRLLAQAYEAKGRFPEAIVESKLIVKLSPGSQVYLGHLARLYAVAGKTTEARRILAQLKEQSKTAHVSPVLYALIYGALGETDQAFAWLDKAYEERNSGLIPIATAPWFDPLRSDPRFAEFMRRFEAAKKPLTPQLSSSPAAQASREARR